MLQSELCDHSDAYILVKGTITVQTENNRAIDGYNRNLILRINAPFINCISNINNILIDNAEALDIVMPMYNLIEYSKNYSKTSGSLWNYYKDIPVGNITNSKSFKYKTSIRKNIFACLFSVHNTISLSRHEQVCLMKLRFERYFSHHRDFSHHHRPDDGRSIFRNVASLNILAHDVINLLYYNKTSIIGKTTDNGNTKEGEFSVPLNHLSNFWGTLDMPLINYKVSRTLTWSKNCVITDERTQDAHSLYLKLELPTVQYLK